MFELLAGYAFMKARRAARDVKALEERIADLEAQQDNTEDDKPYVPWTPEVIQARRIALQQAEDKRLGRTKPSWY